MAADGWGNKMLPFLAVGRVKDATMLACHINTESDAEDKTMDVFKKLLAAAASKLSAGQRTRLQWNDGSVCCLMDSKGENLYCVVTSLLTYPERLAYQLLYDLVAQASTEPDLATAEENSLNDRLGPKMKDLVTYYEDAKNFPQFALGMSRESLSSSPGSTPNMGSEEGGGRSPVFYVLILIVLGIIGFAVYTFWPTQAPASYEEAQEVASSLVVSSLRGFVRKDLLMMT